MSKIYDALQELEAQRKAMEAGGSPVTAGNPLDLQERPVHVVRSTPQPLLERAVAVTRFNDELRRRMGESGLDGVHGLFALADRLHRALATVSRPELETAEADLERVATQVRAMKDRLQQLKVVKSELEGPTGLSKP